jgi:hypothetical protein
VVEQSALVRRRARDDGPADRTASVFHHAERRLPEQRLARPVIDQRFARSDPMAWSDSTAA